MNDLRFHRKWYTNSFKPALDKALNEGLISKYIYDKLNESVKEYEFEYKS